MKAIIFFLFLVFFCCKAQDSGTNKYSKFNSVKMDNHSDSITILGIANNAKLGAIVLTTNKEIYYIESIDSWSDEIVGKKLKVNGILKKEYFNEGDLLNEKGEFIQGIAGEKLCIQNAHWELLPEKE